MIPGYLMAAILDRPADDTPRLVAADWLDDYAGDLPDPAGARGRAELIRLQCRQAEIGRTEFPHDHSDADDPPCGVCGEYDAARTRAGQLLSNWSREWFRDAVPGGMVSNWSPYNPEPYFVLPGGNHFVNVGISRGFIGAVSLPVEAFVGPGVACPHCADAPASWDTGVVECRRCDSTGILCDALAADLFALHPITGVELAGREPEPPDGYHHPRWTWHRENYVRRRSDLPDLLFYLIPSAVRVGNYSFHDTEASAYAALSAACVEYGRQAAAGARAA